jgi:hypothetical protein
MASPDWFEIALGVLPPLPHEVTCIRDDGGQLRISLIEQRGGHLYGQLSLLDAREGLALTIPIDGSDGGGYSIGCEIQDIYFMGGLESAAKITVTEVRRRKPYRSKERVEADSAASLHVIASKRLELATTLFARVLDVSASGIGFSTEAELEAGDRLRIDTAIGAVKINAEIRVVQSGRMSFGRWRAGCQFTRLPLETEHLLEQLAAHPSRKAA